MIRGADHRPGPFVPLCRGGRRSAARRALAGTLTLLLLATGFGAPGAGAQTARPARSVARAPDLPADFQLGLEVAAAIGKGIGLSDDEAQLQRLNRIGYRIAAVGADASTHYSFAILDLDEPNAMALPGGFLFVTRGMLAADISDAELAHLIGHEISHVELNHHARASRVNAIASLARTALMIGILLGASDGGWGTERVAVSDDPGRRDYEVGMTGSQALLQASSLFGGVLQALLERGYSRQYEFEADEQGCRLAVRAGYEAEAGVALLQRLHERSYEGNRFSYWRTHPYFEDRLARARVRAMRSPEPASPPENASYRQRHALFFASAAERLEDEELALLLFRRALRCEPDAFTSLTAQRELVRFRQRREERQHPIERRYGELLASYDRLIAQAEAEDPDWEALAAVRQERTSLAVQRDALLADYLTALDSADAPTRLLERFVENYPDHARVPGVRHRLGLHALLADRPEAAVDHFRGLLAASDGAAWSDSALAGLQAAVPRINDLTFCYRLSEEFGREAPDAARAQIGRAAQQRLDALVRADLSLEQGGRFLRAYPHTPWSSRVRRKIAAQADETYRYGRVQEGMERYQEALDAYFEVVAFAPDTPAASQAENGIDRINRLEELN